MPIARLDLVGIPMFGGPALPGKCKDLKFTDRNLDPANVMEAIGAYPHGLIDIEELYKVECTVGFHAI